MLAVTSKTANADIYITKFIDFNTDAVKDAEKVFYNYKQENVILNNSFYDSTWLLTNEVKTFIFDFSLPETLFRSQKKQPNNRELCSLQDFVNAVKVYFLYALGHTTLQILQQFLAALKKVIQHTGYFNPFLSDWLLSGVKFPSNFYTMLTELTNFIPFYDIDEFQEACSNAYYEVTEEVRTNKQGQPRNQRQLAEFQSYFYFDKLLNQFWDFMATNEEKLLYYPVYIWWRISNIIPLRPTELIVTPFDCIRTNDEGEYFLTVRRTKLKGRTKRKSKGTVTHKVESDYVLYEYPVSPDIAQVIIDYKGRVKPYGETKFLFSKQAYYANHRQTAEESANTDVFTIRNIRKILTDFYKNVLQSKFGLNLYYKPHHHLREDKIILENEDRLLKPNEIMIIHLGDTRHFSMVNLVLNDFNPILIKDFAGHEDVNQSYHYFSHIDKIVKCMSYYKFQELRKDTIDSGLLNLNESTNLISIVRGMTNRNEPYKEVDYGRCYSKKFYIGDISDCKRVYGDCLSCDYFTLHDENYGDMIEIRRKELEKRLREEGLLLLNLLTTYNDTYDNYADFQRRILQIQQATSEYMKLSEKLI